MKLIDKQSRSKLGEGRDHGMGFGFCKLLSSGDFTTVTPISPCKDYLNEVVYTESTGIASSAHGLKYSKTGCLDRDKGYIAFKIMPFMDNSEYREQKEHCENLNKNYLNIQKFLNIFEEKLGIKDRTEILKLDDTYILVIPKEWTTGTYKISLYTLLTRVGQFYDGTKEVMKYLETFDAWTLDNYLMKQALPKIKIVMEKGLVEQDMNRIDCPHNYGIVGYNL